MAWSASDAERAFAPVVSLEEAMDLARALVAPAGFDVLTYDFSPVPRTHDGAFIQPTVLSMRNAPDDMERLWRRDGFFSRDPVMDAALKVSRPFTWSHQGRQSAVMRAVLNERHRPVVEYLIDTGMGCGITVPIRGSGGSLATFSAIRLGAPRDDDLPELLSAVGHLAHVLHDAVMPGFPPRALQTPHVMLTRRERQCMMLCAAGLTTKEIAHEIGRSTPTVTLHLGSAAEKLGARNRAHALALAAHYRLLEPDA